MHEHMRNRLPPMEEGRSRIKERESLIHEGLVQCRHHHYEGIDDYDVLYCCRDIGQKASAASVVV